MDSFQILVSASPGPYAGSIFYYFFISLWIFFGSLTWDPTGAKISKRYFPYKSQPKAVNLFRNFLPHGPHKTTIGFLKFWNWNFNAFIALLDYSQTEGYSMGLMASRTFCFFPTKLSLKIQCDSFHKQRVIAWVWWRPGIFFSTKLSLNILTYINFKISNLILFKRLKLNTVANGNWKIANILEMGSRRAKQSEILASRVNIQCIL